MERGQQEPECSRLGEHFLPQIKQPAWEGEIFFPAGRLAGWLKVYARENITCKTSRVWVAVLQWGSACDWPRTLSMFHVEQSGKAMPQGNR